MAFRAELTIEDRSYRVLYCSHTIKRDTDSSTGKPNSRPKFGRIDLEIESTDDIFLWDRIGFHNYEGMSGKIIFKKRDEEVKMKELSFQGAFVVEHTEVFQSYGDSPMKIRFSLSAEMLIMDGTTESCEISNEWPVASEA